MSSVRETWSSGLIGKSSFLPSSNLHYKNCRSFLPLRRTKVQLRSAASQSTTPTAPISRTHDFKIAPPQTPLKFKANAVITVRNKIRIGLHESLIRQFEHAFGFKNVVLELVSTHLHPKTKALKKSSAAVMKKCSKKSDKNLSYYTAEFVVDSDFGIPGAITVINEHNYEFFLETITVGGFGNDPLHFPCRSWIQSVNNHPGNRVFFSNQPYLPDETPPGVKALRDYELRELRGDGKGERKLSDRVYDFDLYNDLGNPDKGIDFARPILGGNEIPYPRRCRTGRPPMVTDRRCETRVEKPLPMYVPKDEQFEETKMATILTCRRNGMLRNLLPNIMAFISGKNKDFDGFEEIDSLYSEGLLDKVELQNDILKTIPLPKEVRNLRLGNLLKYNVPDIIAKDKYTWLRDDEFARQAIAGVNPMSIERLRVFPPVSKLDLEIYGPKESALKHEHLIRQLNGLTVQEAMDANRLYIIDYHDIYLPFLDKINRLDGRKSYATRSVLFLTNAGTLKPVAIELSLPPSFPKSQSKHVVTPPVDATSYWMWQLAKLHVCSNDSGVHQLINHWLHTHAVLEPFILAAHRQMSTMHPVFKLLDPHMRYTLEINALARQSLISVDGVIESCFTPGRYCMEISAAAYKNKWRFDQEGLPEDLIRRGMAIPDATEPHGLKLTIEDYPYAADGLMIWSAIENWVTTYVNRYYPNSSRVQLDPELQSWYAESINVGHADLRLAPWWPTLATPSDLISILTTIIWLASAQHAALNFGQYPYGGYIPNRPPLVRRLIPEKDDPEHAIFAANPERYFFATLPSLVQATKFMAVVDSLSTHSKDEEYLGERSDGSIWSGDREVVEAFYKFTGEMRRIEKEIERRNRDGRLKNRCGAGVMAYELLAPSSEAGVTCRGVPNSVTI